MIAQLDKNYIKLRPLKLYSRLVSYLFFEGRPLTTSGQWINPLLFALFYIQKKIPQLKKVHQPTFILGTGRSGTTILGMLLSMHKSVGYLNEPKALWHSIYKFEDLIGSYSLEDARYRLDHTDVNDKLIKDAKKLFGFYLTAACSSRVVDKYPELIFRVPFIKAIFPDAKFIFLARNGWDTCHSIENWSNRLGVSKDNEVHDWWGLNRRKWNYLVDELAPEHSEFSEHIESIKSWNSHTDMAALEWILTMREGLKVVKEYPNDVLQVNYELLCDNPREKLGEIAGFMGLELKDEKFYQYAETTLRKAKPKPEFTLNPVIKEAFLETMQRLSY